MWDPYKERCLPFQLGRLKGTATGDQGVFHLLATIKRVNALDQRRVVAGRKGSRRSVSMFLYIYYQKFLVSGSERDITASDHDVGALSIFFLFFYSRQLSY